MLAPIRMSHHFNSHSASTITLGSKRSSRHKANTHAIAAASSTMCCFRSNQIGCPASVLDVTMKSMNKHTEPVKNPYVSAETQWRTYLAESATLSFTLRNGDVVSGKALWLDKFNFSVDSPEHGPIIIPKHAVVWYKRL